MPTLDPLLADSLARFVAAQDPVFERVLAELRAGRKRSHWMWFVFPQLRGLGRSVISEYFGIRDLEEARAYLRHPVLGPRLLQCIDILMTHDKSAREIFGTPDDLKLCSSLTLFEQVAEDPRPFSLARAKFCRPRPADRAATPKGDTK